MHRDTEEALERLEQALLEDSTEETAEEAAEEAAEDFGDFLEFAEGETPMVYRNFSNNYGKNLRNYATGYQAYSSHQTDEQISVDSRQARTPEKSGGLWLPILAVVLAALAVGYQVWLLGGML